MADKKSKEDIEKEILAEAMADSKTEKKAPAKPVSTAPKTNAVKERPEPKKKGNILERATETLKDLKDSKKDEEKVIKDTRVKGSDRLYTVPLYRHVPRRSRGRLAINTLRNFVQRHTKAEVVVITKEVNEKIWERGRKKPPRSIRIKVSQDDEGRAVVELYGEKKLELQKTKPRPQTLRQKAAALKVLSTPKSVVAKPIAAPAAKASVVSKPAAALKVAQPKAVATAEVKK